MDERKSDGEARVLGLTEAAAYVADSSGLVHLTGIAGCTASLLAHRVATATNSLVVLLVADAEAAQRAADDLEAAFGDPSAALVLPAAEATPFDGVRSDRRTAMLRAAALGALDTGRCRAVAVSAAAWVRRAAPPEALRDATLRLRLGEPLDLEAATRRLEAGGYLRTPVVEDPGTFAVRGALLDLWPPGDEQPLRAELFGDDIHTLRRFDPENQRGGAAVTEALVPPAREAILTPEARERARERMRDLCDAVNLPSTQARALIEDVATGRLFMGSEAYLPAYRELVPFFERLPENATLLVEDPPRFVAALREELGRGIAARAVHGAQPHFAFEEHYLDTKELTRSLQGRRVVACHRSVVGGGAPADVLEALEAGPLDAPTLASSDQRELAAHLEGARKAGGKNAGLGPLVRRITAWQQDGLDVTLTARVVTQADRLTALLEHRALDVARAPEDLLAPVVPGRLRVIASPLSRGAVIEGSGRVFATEEEIFGRRRHRAKRSAARAVQAALDDLRNLQPGDYVVHVEHGIGKYLGLEHRQVGDHFVDLLAVEYRGGDKLYVPVYRLNQVQKYSGTEAAPRLDRLGGVTFAKTKSKVRKQVRQLADSLLRLYAERSRVRRPPLPPPDDEYAAFEAAFPYEETPDQAAAIAEVLEDLQRDTVMDRLVCGDVGFGKTEVALRAAYLNVLAGRQVALLCPTTVLAQQHYLTFDARLAGTGANVRVLSRFQSKKQQTETVAGLKQGTVDVVIGTHRLLSQDVHFKNLGLLVVDEEQRFGVTHKERIKQLRTQVDVLTLSATPIPRTLSMAVSGLRDMSVISTPPQDRRAIRTLTSSYDDELLRAAIEREIDRGGQVFYVYNRVEGLHERAAKLQALVPGLRVAVAHGQMSETQLERAMAGFIAGDFDVLVTTAIIESGLDIPRANTMIVDRADLFGLSQLYQLRGRVGRSSERAYCYLLVPPPSKLSDEARSRIEALERYTDLGSGFHIATLDMELRGAGEMLGAEQSGFVTSVGFDLFSQMLQEATAELSGQTVEHDVDPDLSVDVEALLPDDYVEDVGVRLSLYKRYSAALDEDEVARLGEEIADRFGPPPPEARRLADLMRLKTELRRLKALACNATPRSVTLHLRDDTPLTPARLVALLAAPPAGASYSLSPDGRLTRRVPAGRELPDGLAHAERMVAELSSALEGTPEEGS
jgi:transcription-repair coupling factor (superfamily II helicase)